MSDNNFCKHCILTRESKVEWHPMLIQLADHLGYARYAITAASNNVPLNRDLLSSKNGVGKTGSLCFRTELRQEKRSSTDLPEVGGDYLGWTGNCVSHLGLHDYLYIPLAPVLRRIPQSLCQVLGVRN